MRNVNVVMAGTVAAVAVLDQLSKIAVLTHLTPGEPYFLLGTWFRFYLTFNSGAAFSMGEGHTWIFTLIQIGFVLAVAIAAARKYFTDYFSAIAAALIAGGALGNLIDRLFRAPGFFIGHVVDFISVGNFAIFNVADSAITTGAVLFVLANLRPAKSATATTTANAEE